MALIARRTLSDLGPDLVLVPERYDPRRDALAGGTEGRSLEELVLVSSAMLPADRVRAHTACIVLDTTHARDGLVEWTPPLSAARSVGSAKKVLAIGDVILSRLRPYLRQVAWLDRGLLADARRATLVGSSEFLVLRPRDARSIAFLVPFLLSETVQSILAASQEGGHHPRVGVEALLGLRVPARVLARRDQLSRRVALAIDEQRAARRALAKLSWNVERSLGRPRAAG